MAREDPQLKVRMSEDLHRRVVDAAREAGRSLNGEIVHRLEKSFVTEAAPPDDQLYKAVHAMLLRMKSLEIKFNRSLFREAPSWRSVQVVAEPPDQVVIGNPRYIRKAGADEFLPPPRTARKRSGE